MALYQTSVLKNYLNLQDTVSVEKSFKKYKKYFYNATIQENIKKSKEEEYQGIFLTELFVNILGYTLNPMPNYNLVVEKKNETNAQKADGAILNNNSVIAVIELKGTNTKDLESIRKQAFDYKANQKGCEYIITSNFEKLRFYINDATEYEEFNLFTLTENEFALLYICLSKESLINGIPLKIKEESVIEEDKITKQFYTDYSVFKRELYRDLVKRNAKRIKQNAVTSSAVEIPQKVDDQKALEKNVKLSLFKKSQKLIDRFLFIFFAEDRNLLPANSTIQILDKWKADMDFGDERPLYSLFKQYFNFLDTGRVGTKSRAEIYAYNGGLFKPDTILDDLVIDDNLLYKYTYKLAKYDFDSQVDVNILGHIFENSLNEIESVNAEIEGGEFDKQKSKRKKDGVFYTPKYITKYIVENTIGKLCTEKKEELGFKEEAFYELKKGTHLNTKKQLLEILDTYRAWLLQITICDPACGSGAFLNQALDFLIKEHRYIDELNAKVLGGGLILSDIENTILENNIYGVDLNEESVEIAKLSLWLRTAQPRRKLNDLSNTIKCGNSLIDSKAVAGDKAFNWQLQFPQIFAKGGFDVVIGNPPYVRQELFIELKETLNQNYEVYQGQADLYVYFFEKGIKILKPDGLFSIIVANKWLKVSYAEELRKWMSKIKIIEIIDFGDLPVFEDATAYPCIVTLLNNKNIDLFNITITENLKFSSLQDYVSQNQFSLPQKNLNKDSWKLVDKKRTKLLEKLNKSGNTIHSYTDGIIRRGIVTGFNDAFIINENIKKALELEHFSSKEIIKPYLAGRDVKKYLIEPKDSFIIFTRRGINIEKYPAIKSYLLNFKDKLEPKPKDWKGKWSGRKSGNYKWYEIQDSIDYYLDFEKDKIIYPNICNKPIFTLDSENYYTNQKCFIIPKNDKPLLSILNSSVMMFLYEMCLPKLRGGYFEPGYIHIKHFPIPNISDNNKNALTVKVDHILELNKNSFSLQEKFKKYFQSTLLLEKLSNKLQNWYELEFGNFIKELNKAIKTSGGVPLTKKDEFEWLEVFEENKQKAQELQTQINHTEKEIDRMVYKLYNLTEEEIQIVENS